ncbi:hypothetical protein GCM10023187_36000 [Nibrella viscosa]|uniref:Uncharacterized protein n=2 Tax=Nibrella viscosa TaxID=1084524 RepID=A0ABP8KNB4_9BACT
MGRAQQFPLQVQVNVMPPYSAYLQDYPGTGQQVRVFISNTSPTTYRVRLSGQLIGDNGVEIRTAPNYRPPRPLMVPPGQTLLNRTDLEGLFDLNQIEVTGIDKNLLARGLPLPDGTYQLCVRIFNETVSNTTGVAFGQPLSAEFPLGCSAPIVVRAADPPILVSPLCDASITPTTPQATVFTWTPPVGVSPTQVEYTLRIVELPQVNIDPNVFIDAITLPRSGVEVRNLRTSTFLYGPTQPPLVVGKRYAWRVQAIDRSRKLNLLNDGKSPVCLFTYGSGPVQEIIKPGIEIAQTPIPVGLNIPGLTLPSGVTLPTDMTATAYMLPASCSCKTPPAGGDVVDNSKALAQKSATIAGGFPLTFLLDVKEDPAKKTLSGTVMVPMPVINSSYARVRCRLVDVQCNAAGEVISGFVQAIQTSKPGPWPAFTKPDINPPALSSDQISNLGSFWDSYKEGLVSEANNAKQSIGWEVPFGIEKKFGGTGGVFTITDLTLTPADAYFNANMWISVPEVAKFKGIPLSASRVCIKWNGSGSETCGDKVLYLADKVEFGSGSLKVSLKGPDDVEGPPTPATATSVRYDANGFAGMRIVAGITTPGLLRKKDNLPLEMKMTYDLPTPDFSNWMGQVQSEDDFYVAGMSDFVLSMRDPLGKLVPAMYDHDDVKNPGIMPEGYDPGKDPTWHGLYMPALSITMPFLKSLNNGKDVPIGVKGMIYDANGFTGKAFAGTEKAPLIALGDGSMGGWYCSTEQLSLTFLQSSFVSGGLNGQVVLPIFKYNTGDDASKPSVWPWTCTYTKVGESFQFVVSPKNDAYVDLWKAQLTIQKQGKALTVLKNGQPNTTAITATYNASGFNAKAVLNMTLSLNTGVVVAPGMSVEGLAFQTSPPAGEDFFDPGLFTAGLNSPQRYIAGDSDESGLPLELKEVSVTKAASKKTGEYDLNLTGGLNLTNISSIKAGATGYVRFWVGNNSKGRPDWKYIDTGITGATVSGVLGPVSLSGALNLFGYNGAEDGKYGKGLKAELTVAVLGASFGGAALQGYFGSKADDSGRFRYWQVGGYADLGSPGVPISPAINFRKFGGGAFNNMQLTLDTTATGEPTGSVSFVPKRGGCGFQAAVGITTTDGSALGLTGRLTVGFNGCDGTLSLSNIAIDANAQLLIAAKPLAEGRGVFAIDFADGKPSVIAGAASLKASYSEGAFYAIGNGTLGLHVDLKNSENFFFYLGKPVSDPAQRVNITFGLKNAISLDFGTYFFMGNAKLAGIAKLPPDPYKVDPALLKQLGYMGGKSASSKALAFGAGLNFEYDNTFGPFYIDFSAQVGYDLVLQNGISCAGDPTGNPPAPAISKPGLNGWYANGQLYAALDLALGIDVDMWFYSGRLEALRVTAAALLEGGMVNPIWLHGSALLKYRVLGGRIKGSVHAEFWYRKEDRCVVAMQQPNPFASMPIIAAVLPNGSSKDPVASITPLYAEFNYPVRALIEVNDVDSQGKPLESFRTFRLDFKPGQQFKLTPFNSKAPASVKCATTEAGRLVMDRSGTGDDASYNATFYRDAALQPFTSYSLTVGIQVYIKSSNCTTSPVANCQNIGPVWAEYMFASKDKSGKLGAPKSVNETQTVTFTTGECNSSLTRDGVNATVSYSFPFEGQRYFTIGDATNGFVEMQAILCCGDKIKSDANFDLAVRFVPFSGKFDESQALMATNVKFDDVRLSYSLPSGLKTQSLYRLDVVRIPNNNFIKAQQQELEKHKAALLAAQIASTKFGGATINPGMPNSPLLASNTQVANGSGTTSINAAQGIQVASISPGAGLGDKAVAVNKTATVYINNYVEVQQFGKGNLANTSLAIGIQESTNATGGPTFKVTPEQQLTAIKKKFEQVLYSYPFQTSRYNTLADKLQDTKVQNSQVKADQTLLFFAALPDGVFSVPVQAQEGFDTYELNWEKVGNGKVRPPMVLLKANPNGNAWFNSFVKPTVDLINAMSQATKINGQKLYTIAGPGGQQYGLQSVDYDRLMRSLMAFNTVFDKPQAPINQAEIDALMATSATK